MRERWRSATDTAWNELSPASPERLGEAARGCSGLSLNGRNCFQNTRSATSATPHPHPHRHASHRDRPICGIHHYKYQSLNELTSENQIHSPLTSGRAQLRARAPAPSPIRDSDCRFGQLPNWQRNWAARAGGRALGAGCVQSVAASVVWVRRAPVTRPSRVRAPTRCFRRQSHGHGGHARRRAQQITRLTTPSYTAVSVTDTRHTHSTHSVHTAQQCSMCRMSNSARSPG